MAKDEDAINIKEEINIHGKNVWKYIVLAIIEEYRPLPNRSLLLA